MPSPCSRCGSDLPLSCGGDSINQDGCVVSKPDPSRRFKRRGGLAASAAAFDDARAGTVSCRACGCLSRLLSVTGPPASRLVPSVLLGAGVGAAPALVAVPPEGAPWLSAAARPTTWALAIEATALCNGPLSSSGPSGCVTKPTLRDELDSPISWLFGAGVDCAATGSWRTVSSRPQLISSIMDSASKLCSIGSSSSSCCDLLARWPELLPSGASETASMSSPSNACSEEISLRLEP